MRVLPPRGHGRPDRRHHRPAHAPLIGVVTVLLIWPALAPGARAQQPPATTHASFDLAGLQRAAERNDPRARQSGILQRQSMLRMLDLRGERFPTVDGSVKTQYQSDVTHLPLQMPGAAPLRGPSRDSYDASVGSQLRLYDPTLAPRRALEGANAAESETRLDVTLHGVRQQVNDAYFAVLRARARRSEVELSLAEMETRLTTARDRLRERVILPSDVAMLEAEMIARRQSIAELDAQRDAALAVLSDLTGRDIGADDSLSVPDLADVVVTAGELPRERPEYTGFARSREVLERSEELLAARDRPRVAVVGRAGYGRPGLNMLGRDFDSYWVAGLQLEWSPWNWGMTDRGRETLELQRQILESEEQAFTDRLRRGVENDRANIRRLEVAMVDDERIASLREQILAEARLRYDEQTLTTAEFVERQTALLTARLGLATHRIQLAESRARYLTTLGMELP